MDIIVIIVVVQSVLILLLVFAVLLLQRRPKESKAEAAAAKQVATATKLRPDELERLHHSTEDVFTKAVNESAQTFHTDLKATSQQLNRLIVRLTTDVVERELQDYRDGLAAAREEAVGSLRNMQNMVEQTQKDLEADVNAQLEKRQQHLIEQLDKRLGETVAAYIVESLGQGADLGAQRAFLLESLERHKEDLKREITGG
jgi:uncharacterized protein YbjQ (UPF0145 family)